MFHKQTVYYDESNNPASKIRPNKGSKKLAGYALKTFTLIIIIALVGTIAWAAFSDKGKVLGSTFSVASLDLKLLENLSGGTTASNLKDEIQGPSFSNIGENWISDYPIKIYNSGTQSLALISNANYTTANDPDELRSYIYVEPLVWEDADNNGIVNTGEEGLSLGKKTIIKWKTEGYDLGSINIGEVKGWILRFTSSGLSDTKQGKTAIFDFEFSAIGL